MASLNKVILIGNLGRDPEIKAFQNGDRIANFSIAVVVEGKLTYRKFVASDGLEKMSTEIVIGPFDGQLTLLPGNDTSNSKFSSFAEPTEKDDELDDEIPF